jgi:hypothetical protein
MAFGIFLNQENLATLVRGAAFLFLRGGEIIILVNFMDFGIFFVSRKSGNPAFHFFSRS